MKTNWSVKLIGTLSISLIIQLMLAVSSAAQCTGSTIIFSENFGTGGDGTNCFSTTPAPGMGMLMFIPGPTNGGNPPSDGQYSIWCNRVYGWFNWHDPFSDATTDPIGINGNMAIINGINNEFYRKTIPVCPAKTYTVYFSLANLVDADIGSCGPPFDPNITASAYNVGTTTGTTIPIGTIAMSSNFIWNIYSFSFTTGAAQTSIDVVLSNLNGGGCGNDFAFDEFSVVGPSTVLPVELISFSAKRIDENEIQLDWQTASEQNNDYFIVEKSIDAIHFSAIGTLKSKGTSKDLSNYSFTDILALEAGYYRLKQVDSDGKYSYSELKYIEKQKSSILIYPNPNNGTFHIKLDNASNYEIQILTLEGKQTTCFSKEIIEGGFDIKGLSNGLYFTRIKSNSNVSVQRIVVY